MCHFRAAKAKLQRLEKETKEMEKSLETLRHSQAKLAELERINKKLNSQSHEDKKELYKLKEVYNYVVQLKPLNVVYSDVIE